MQDTIRKTPHVHVRPLEIGDFTFVRELASRQPNFTVPPPYVLWLLLRIKGAVTLIAEDSQGPLAYLLAVPVEGPVNSMFVWQFAASESGHQKNAALTLLAECRVIASRIKAEAIFFTVMPDSPSYRLIRKYVQTVFSSTPEARGLLPSSVAQNESEFLIDLTLSRAADNKSQ